MFSLVPLSSFLPFRFTNSGFSKYASENIQQVARRAAEAASGSAVNETAEQIQNRIRVGQRCTVFPGDRRGEVQKYDVSVCVFLCTCACLCVYVLVCM